MSGNIGGNAVPGSDSGSEWQSFLERLVRRVEDLEGAAAGPVAGWLHTLDEHGFPAYRAISDGTTVSTVVTTDTGASLDDIEARVDDLARNTPVPGWTWGTGVDDTILLVSPAGTSYVVAVKLANLATPIAAVGDSNTTNKLTALPRTPWFDLLFEPHGRNLADGGHGWTVPGFDLFSDSLAGLGPTTGTLFATAGINDIAGLGASASTIETAIVNAIQQWNRWGVDVLIGTIIPIRIGATYDAGEFATFNAVRVAVNDWIRNNWTIRGASYVDIAAAVEQSTDGPMDPAYDLGDGVHLNQQGQSAIADAVRSILRL